VRLIVVSKLWMAALALPLLLLLLLLLPADCTGAPPPSPPLPLVKPCSVAGMKFCDPSLPVEERAANLVAELTLEEKIAQLSTYSFAKKYRHRYTPPVPRIGASGCQATRTTPRACTGCATPTSATSTPRSTRR
jgi:hypothetical protein